MLLQIVVWLLVIFLTLFLNIYLVFKVSKVNKDEIRWIRIPIIIEKKGIAVKTSWLNFRYDELVGIRPYLDEKLEIVGSLVLFKTLDSLYVPTKPSTLIELLSLNHYKVPMEIRQVAIIREDEIDDFRDFLGEDFNEQNGSDDSED